MILSNRAKWDAAGPQSYRYDLTLGCFCGFGEMPLAVVVSNGEMLSMTSPSGVPVALGRKDHILLRYSTIEGVFAELGNEVETPNRYVLELAFDPEIGFPTLIRSDSWRVTDAGLYVGITNFQALP